MPTRNLQKNQDKNNKAIVRNRNNTIKSVEKDYQNALSLIRAELMKIIERTGKINNEVMSKFSRRQKLFKKINDDILNPLFRNVTRKTKRMADTQYKQGYFRNAWAIDQNVGVKFKWRLNK